MTKIRATILDIPGIDRVNSYREVAVEQARNQPKTVTYNNIYWR